MIKSIMQVIPSYVMSIFQLPSTLINYIKKMMNSLWQGQGRTTHRGINWLSWEKILMYKSQGGMSFKDFSSFNLAMLGKLQTKSESHVSRFFKARYFPNTSYLTGTGHNPSYV